MSGFDAVLYSMHNFFSPWSRYDCVVKGWKLRSFRITGGSLSMKDRSMLCLRGFYIGFFLQQWMRRNSAVHLQITHRAEELDCPQSETLLTFSSSPQAHIVVAAKADAEGSVWCQQEAASLLGSVWCVCTSLPSAGRHRSTTAVSKQQPRAKGAFSSVCMSVIQ